MASTEVMYGYKKFACKVSGSLVPILQATESWAGPGNKAKLVALSGSTLH